MAFNIPVFGYSEVFRPGKRTDIEAAYETPGYDKYPKRECDLQTMKSTSVDYRFFGNGAFDFSYNQTSMRECFQACERLIESAEIGCFLATKVNDGDCIFSHHLFRLSKDGYDFFGLSNDALQERVGGLTQEQRAKEDEKKKSCCVMMM